MGPILSTIIGAGIKLLCNLVNNWMEQKRQDQMLLAARDNKIIEIMARSQAAHANDPFIKATRRILFMTITFTYCFLMVWYALNPGISYTVVLPKDGGAGFFGWLFGSDDYKIVELTGGLLLMSFVDLVFMVVGFYSLPSRKR